MHLLSLALSNYRNYAAVQMDFGQGLNVLVGSNAQGKTNLLESIYFCALGRSHRTTQDIQLIRWGNERAKIDARIQHAHSAHDIHILLQEKQKKRIEIDGLGIKRLGELMGVAMVVLFSPGDLQLVQQGPAGRRRYLDILISQAHPHYFYLLQRYLRVLKQRNMLLRSGDLRAIDVFDQQLAILGVEIVKQRARIVELLAVELESIHGILSQGEQLQAQYAGCVELDTNEVMQERYRLGLRKSLPMDCKLHMTRFGIHREDIQLFIDTKPARSFASQGQQRSVAVSLRLAQCKVMQSMCGDAPILLLDDVLSELDAGRQKRLLGMVESIQTILTGTDVDDHILKNTAHKMYRVENGKLQTILN